MLPMNATWRPLPSFWTAKHHPSVPKLTQKLTHRVLFVREVFRKSLILLDVPG
jgi:hypothetical protein